MKTVPHQRHDDPVMYGGLPLRRSDVWILVYGLTDDQARAQLEATSPPTCSTPPLTLEDWKDHVSTNPTMP